MQFVKPGQEVPQALITDLLRRYSTKEGYRLYPDVLPFFEALRNKTSRKADDSLWPWDKTIIGIITNSDDRVPGILESFDLKVGPRRVSTFDTRSREAILADDINFVVLSYDVGFEKPHRQMFDTATKMLREILTANQDSLKTDDFEKLYVGDELEKDYLGAQCSGWSSVYLDRGSLTQESQEGAEMELFRMNMSDRQGKKTQVVAISDMRALGAWSPSTRIEELKIRGED